MNKRKLTILSLVFSLVLLLGFAFCVSAAETDDLGDPVETWDISATTNDNVVANLYNDPENEGMYTLVISGTGYMKGWQGNTPAPWYSNYCNSISASEINSGVKNVGAFAFAYCSSLKSINIPEGVEIIGDYAFYKCSDLNTVNLPQGIKKISYYGFAYCTSLSKIVLKEGLTTLQNCAFAQCTSLDEIELPESLSYIGIDAFYGCYIDSVYINNIDAYCRISFDYNPYNPNSTPNSYPYRSSPLSYGGNLYLNNELVTEVIVPNDVNTLHAVFAGYNHLERIVLPETLTDITWYAFYGCDNLTTINIPNNVKKIMRYTFSGTSISNIEIPNSVTYIETNAFKGCTNLISVKIPNSVVTIEKYAFYECTNLASIEIPKSTKYISNYAFQFCTNLKLVTISSPTIASSITASDSYGYLTSYATTVAIKSDITEVGSYITDNFTSVTTMGDYVIYSKHSHEADSSVWSEKDGNCVQVCSECGLQKVAHDYDMVTDIIYDDFAKAGVKVVECVCGAVKEEVADALFISLGYSASEFDVGGITAGYKVNNEAISEYEAVTGNVIKYGVLAALESNLGTGEAISELGAPTSGVISKEISSYELNAFNLKLVGFTTEKLMEARLTMCAYILDADETGTSVSYIQAGALADGEKYCYVSYNSLTKEDEE